MDNAEFISEIRQTLKALAGQLNAHPFADRLLFDGKMIPRSRARAIERELWPLAYPKADGRRRVA